MLQSQPNFLTVYNFSSDLVECKPYLGVLDNTVINEKLKTDLDRALNNILI